MVGLLMFQIIMNSIPMDISETTAFNEGGTIIDGAADIGSLQRPILGQKLAFGVVPGEMVQILHSGGNH